MTPDPNPRIEALLEAAKALVAMERSADSYDKLDDKELWANLRTAIAAEESRASAPDVQAVLEAIIKCECVFRVDPLEYCHNAVEHMRSLATKALHEIQEANNVRKR
jgi:hypothetical protein